MLQIKEGVCRSNLHSKSDRRESKGEKTKGICGFYASDRELLWQVLRMYDVSGKLLKGIKRMYVNCKSKRG